MKSENRKSSFRKTFVLLTLAFYIASAVIAARFFFLEEAFYPINSLKRSAFSYEPFGLPLFWGTIFFSLIFIRFWFKSNRLDRPRYVYRVLLLFAPNFFLALALVVALNNSRTVIEFVQLNEYSGFFQGFKFHFYWLFIKGNILDVSLKSLYRSRMFLLYWFWTPQILTFFLTILLTVTFKFLAIFRGRGGQEEGSEISEPEPDVIKEIRGQVKQWEREGYEVKELREMLKEWSN